MVQILRDRRSQQQVNGGVEKYQGGQEWGVVELMAVRVEIKNAELAVSCS